MLVQILTENWKLLVIILYIAVDINCINFIAKLVNVVREINLKFRKRELFEKIMSLQVFMNR